MKKKQVGLMILLVIAIIFIVVIYLFFKQTFFRPDKNLSSDITSLNIGQGIVYSIDKYTGATAFYSNYYFYDPVIKKTNLLFEFQNSYIYPGDFFLSQEGMAYIDRSSDSIIYKKYNGRDICSISRPGANLYYLISDEKNTKFAYQSIIVDENISEPTPDDSQFSIIVNDSNCSQLFKIPASDFFYNGKQMRYIEPLVFNDSGNILYFIASPYISGDVGDWKILFSFNLLTGEKRQLLFTGNSKIYDSQISQGQLIDEGKNSLLFNHTYPRLNFAIVEKPQDRPNKMFKYDFNTQQFDLLFDPATIDNEATLNPETDGLSPNGKYLVMDRGGFLTANKTIDTYNNGFHLLNIETGQLVRDLKIKGQFLAWLGNDKIVYKEYRHAVWDDQYQTLNILDIKTMQSTTVYTQTYALPYSPGTIHPGDEIYHFFGVVNN